jgi:hypothetical protein
VAGPAERSPQWGASKRVTPASRGRAEDLQYHISLGLSLGPAAPQDAGGFRAVLGDCPESPTAVVGRGDHMPVALREGTLNGQQVRELTQQDIQFSMVHFV